MPLTPWQTLILWALLARGGTAFWKDLEPALQKKNKERDALVRQKLLETAKGPKGAMRVGVTEEGWAEAPKHLGNELPATKAAAAILCEWLNRLARYMEVENASLAEILAPPTTSPETRSTLQLSPSHPEPIARRPDPPATSLDYASLRDRIRTAYLELTGGRLNSRALLRDIRDKLKDIDRAALDEALKRMQREEDASLYQLDNRIEITDADRAAAIYFGVEPRHILWIER
jgi:hypothetical protein